MSARVGRRVAGDSLGGGEGEGVGNGYLEKIRVQAESRQKRREETYGAPCFSPG